MSASSIKEYINIRLRHGRIRIRLKRWWSRSRKRSMCCKRIISRTMRFISMKLPYKVSSPEFQANPEASRIIRRYNARIEVNPVFAIVEKNGMSEEITALYSELRRLNCVYNLFVRDVWPLLPVVLNGWMNSLPTGKRVIIKVRNNRKMSENNKIGTYRFVAEPFHVDFNGRLTMGYWNIICWTVRAFMPVTVVWDCNPEWG